MRIVVASENLKRISGHSRLALGLSSALRQSGFDVHAISTTEPGLLAEDSVSGGEGYGDIHFVGVHNVGGPNWRPIERVLSGADIVHCFDIVSGIKIQRWLERKSVKRVPVLFTPTSKQNLTLSDLRMAGPLAILNFALPINIVRFLTPPGFVKMLLRRFELMLCPSRYIESNLVDLGLPESKLAYMGYGVSHRNLELGEVSETDGPLDIQYLGWGSSLRGTNDALAAYLLAREMGLDGRIRFNILGSHKLEEKFIVSKIQSAAVGNPDVSISIGYNPRILEVIGSGHVVLLPFRSSFGYCQPPLALLESMILGKVPVSTTVGSIREYVRHGESGFLCGPGDTKSMATHLVSLANKTTRKRMGANAKEEILALTDWRRIAQQAESSYEGVLRK
jgi:glycosyltransferase involved in cell wall biosynthesis